MSYLFQIHTITISSTIHVVGSRSIVESLMSALLNGNTYAGVPIAELPDNLRTIKEAFENLALPGQLENLVQATNDPNAPRAHLNVLFFNDKLELVEGGSSITQVPAVPMGGNMGGFATLTPVGPITGGGTQACCIAPGPGYAVIYIDNQSIGKDVWFDNIMIEHYTGKVQEESHYYPYGLTLQTSAELNYKEQPYKYNGKELERSFGLEMYDYGARMQDPQLGVWHQVDPLAEQTRRWSPYVYALDNPIRFIDPDGMTAGDFLDKNGKIIGNDGINDGKVYVVKTTEKEFDSGVPSAGINKEESKATIKFIETNSGNSEAFKNDNIAYNNSIEIEGNSTTRQGMVDIVNKDDGKGGTSEANNREYGGRVREGSVIESPPGRPGNPKNDLNVAIVHPNVEPNDVIFHSHSSGHLEESEAGGTRTYKWLSAPSAEDLDNASTTNYVFSRSNGIVYIITKSGVVATLPQSRFVSPKK